MVKKEDKEDGTEAERVRGREEGRVVEKIEGPKKRAGSSLNPCTIEVIIM